MFNYPATSVYDASGVERVVWSQEEYDDALAEGWSEERPTEPTAALIQEEQAVKLPAAIQELPAKRRK